MQDKAPRTQADLTIRIKAGHITLDIGIAAARKLFLFLCLGVLVLLVFLAIENPEPWMKVLQAFVALINEIVR